MDIAASILNFGMSIYITFNMPTIEPSFQLHKYLHLKHVLGICPKSPLDFIFGKDIAIDGHMIDKAKHFIEQIQLYIKWYKNSWRRVKPSTKKT
jgi:hypothetical protein